MGYWVDEQTERDLLNKIKEVEQEYGICVYAVTHEKFEFGECFSMLYISKYKEDAYRSVERIREYKPDNVHAVHAWVYNADCDSCSEFGTV